MIQSAEGISDLLFVANRTPQVEVHGRLKPATPESPEACLPARVSKAWRKPSSTTTRAWWRICQPRFLRLQLFVAGQLPVPRQHLPAERNYAMVLRRLQSKIPTMDSLQLPPVFREVIKEKNGSFS